VRSRRTDTVLACTRPSLRECPFLSSACTSSKLEIVVFHQGGTLTADFQGESAFDPSAVPLPPGDQNYDNNVISSPPVELFFMSATRSGPDFDGASEKPLQWKTLKSFTSRRSITTASLTQDRDNWNQARPIRFYQSDSSIIISK